MSKCDLESELSSLLPHEINLLLPAPLLVVRGTFIDIVLAILQHSIYKPCEAVRHGSNSLRGTQFGSQSTVLSAEISLASD